MFTLHTAVLAEDAFFCLSGAVGEAKLTLIENSVVFR